MKEFILKLLAEDSNLSMTRFLSLVCVITACLVLVYGVIKGSDLESFVGICSTFLGFGLGAKVMQRHIESNETDDKK